MTEISLLVKLLNCNTAGNRHGGLYQQSCNHYFLTIMAGVADLTLRQVKQHDLERTPDWLVGDCLVSHTGPRFNSSVAV